jgi:hypothetical protein
MIRIWLDFYEDDMLPWVLSSIHIQRAGPLIRTKTTKSFAVSTTSYQIQKQGCIYWKIRGMVLGSVLKPLISNLRLCKCKDDIVATLKTKRKDYIIRSLLLSKR